MATATHRDVRSVARESYVLTLWTFYQLGQQQYIEGLSARFLALYEAGLMSMAFAEPKKLRGEQHRLLGEAGLNPTTEALVESAQGIIAMVAQLDAVENA